MIKIDEKFDRFLGGGLQPRNLTHIYGPPASGKTNLAIIASVNAMKDGKKAIYIDTEGGFSIERLRQISKDKEVLENLMLMEPMTYVEQRTAIQKLGEMVPKSNVGLIVLDSIASLYRLENNKDTKELGRQISSLLRISRKYNIPVVITNQIYTDINTGRIMFVGGDVIKYWSKVSIELCREGNTRYAVLRKHNFLPEGARAEFRIVDKGVEIIRLHSVHKVYKPNRYNY